MSADPYALAAERDRLRAWITSSDEWYLLIRTPTGFRRLPTSIGDNVRIEINYDSGTFAFWQTEPVTIHEDDLVGGRVVEIGLFNPTLHPDPLDRGDPLPDEPGDAGS